MSMIKSIYPGITKNTDSATVYKTSGIREVSFDFEGNRRTCSAVIQDSNDGIRKARYTITTQSNEYYYDLRIVDN
ncbi:hypothetical protein SAMN04488518_113143 [Pseudovibrio ascidiaceicola]|uniref:Uncharacterized protein n=1 Tax=Pseudovibrio ascidiaceicola TaxID=285279 RepID=A0A1I4E3N5_9HYPH|nr:hypothetical protein SAMN04488518_113143 [Pseudovibrio ascidiaceicola]